MLYNRPPAWFEPRCSKIPASGAMGGRVESSVIVTKSTTVCNGEQHWKREPSIVASRLTVEWVSTAFRLLTTRTIHVQVEQKL